MRTIECPNCMLCQSRGKELFSTLNDRLFGGKGEWGVLSCTNIDCGLVWLSPQPLVDDIREAYSDYYTHKPIDAEKTNTKKIRIKAQFIAATDVRNVNDVSTGL